MALSKELVSQIAKMAVGSRSKKDSESNVYGTTVVQNGSVYVRFDGSELLTPIETTADVNDGERVIVRVKNHTATITGNVSSPAARVGEVREVSAKMSDVESVMAYEVTTDELTAANASIDELATAIANIEGLTAFEADIENLRAKFASLTKVTAEDIDALNADIDNLVAKTADIENLDTETLTAVTASIENLKGHTAKYKYVLADVLSATKADIEDLRANKLSADAAELKYVNVDFANITKAQMEEFYSKSGLIQYVTAEDATVTGHLVGVTISGDLIEGNTIKADKLVVLGEDGIYYKLNWEGGALQGEGVSDIVYYKVNFDGTTYTRGNEIDALDGDLVDGASTAEGDKVYVANVVGKNLYNPATATAGYLVNHGYGAIQEDSGSTVSDYIPVIGGETYFADASYLWSPDKRGEFVNNTNTGFRWHSFDVDKNPLGVGEINNPVIVVPENAAYIRVSYSHNYFTNLQVELGSEPTAYEPYTDKLYYCYVAELPDWADKQLHGSNIVAKSITATEISVSDLVAFDATIGGFEISDGAIHSYDKDSLDNSTRGIYMDGKNGQFAVGDSTNYIKYYRVPTVDENGNPYYEYKLAISAESVLFDSGKKNVGSELSALTERIKIGTYEDAKSGDLKPSIELSEGDSEFKQILTNAEAMFLNGDSVGTKVDAEGLTTTNVIVEEEFRLGAFAWSVRGNGNCGILWKG